MIENINIERMRDLFYKVILLNEIGGKTEYIYKFSDPDGIQTGKSGWSFGLVQYDVNNNANAIHALRDIGFTTDEISGIKDQTIDILPMNDKLLLNKEAVDRWDQVQLSECLSIADSLSEESGCMFIDPYVILHVADYHNQFGMSRGGKMFSFLRDKKDMVRAEDIKDFKLKLIWGIKRPDDVIRRYNNIVKVVSLW